MALAVRPWRPGCNDANTHRADVLIAPWSQRSLEAIHTAVFCRMCETDLGEGGDY